MVVWPFLERGGGREGKKKNFCPESILWVGGCVKVVGQLKLSLARFSLISKYISP